MTIILSSRTKAGYYRIGGRCAINKKDRMGVPAFNTQVALSAQRRFLFRDVLSRETAYLSVVLNSCAGDSLFGHRARYIQKSRIGRIRLFLVVQYVCRFIAPSMAHATHCLNFVFNQWYCDVGSSLLQQLEDCLRFVVRLREH